MTSAVANDPRFWGLIIREAWRRARRRLRQGPLHHWRYAGRAPERVLVAPPDLRVADPQIALDIYHGRFPLAGHVIETRGNSPFQLAIGHRGWNESLHSFRWLRHMRSAGTELAASNARALVSDWMILHGRRIQGLAWEPQITASRVIAWLQHSSVVLKDADYDFYRSFLKSLAAQVRYLRSVVREMPDGDGRLRARIAMAFAALALPSNPATLRTASRNLAEELERQILPDGAHVSRNPAALVEILTDLLPLKQTYAHQSEQPPASLINAIDRMLPALRFFRHGDGSLARFNGMGATVHDRIAAILHHDDTSGSFMLHMPHAGYERLTQGQTVVIADTGVTPSVDLSKDAHAGCLSFELSSGINQFVVNCGVDNFGSSDYRNFARITAAHSTVTVHDTSSARFTFGLTDRIRAFLGTPVLAGPRKVECSRVDETDTQGFVASHDGYLSQFNLIHERAMTLSAQGTQLHGVDRFHAPDGLGIAPSTHDDIVIRFHLHPQVKLYRDADGLLVLMADEHDGWTFITDGVRPHIEESVFFASPAGPQTCKQIVLTVRASEQAEVQWRFLKRRTT